MPKPIPNIQYDRLNNSNGSDSTGGGSQSNTFDPAALKAFNALNRIHLEQQQQQQQQSNGSSRRYISDHHQQQQPVNSNYIHHHQQQQPQQQPQQQQQQHYQLDNNNNNLFNKSLNSFTSTQLSNSIGGVINNLINSTLVNNQAGGNGNGGGGNSGNGVNNSVVNATTAASTAAAAAATAYLLNNTNGLSAAAGANLILANFNQQQQQQHNQQQQQYIDESKCHVCGDKSTGSHFGGISCESCKAFFRRSVQKNRFEDYKCSYSGECKMNTNTRKICQFCRYKTCLSIGMRPKWVLSDDERHQKYGNRRKNKLKVDQDTNKEQTDSSTGAAVASPLIKSENKTTLDNQQTDSNITKIKEEQQDHYQQKSSTHNSNTDDESNNTAESTNNQTASKNDINKLGIDGINMKSNSLNLNSYEKDLIDRLSIAFYHSRKYNSLDLNLQKKLATLFQTQSEGSLKKMSKVILANFIVQPVKRVITFAKLIPDFRKLDVNDQMCLLQGGTMEIFICSSSSLYDQMSNKFMNIVSKDRNIQGNDNSNIQLDILRLIWSEDIFEKTISYLKSMCELKLDEATLILFLPLILFSPDRRDLKERQKIYSIQSKYSFLLKKYMIWKYGLNQNTTKLYNKLLLKLIELRTLHEMHSSILLDADPAQLEPLSHAIISNKKFEANKIKSTSSSEESSQVHDLRTSVQSSVEDTPNSVSLSSPAYVNNRDQTDMEKSDINLNQQVKSNSGTNSEPCLNILTPASSNYGQVPSLSSVSSPCAQTSPISNDLNTNTQSNSVQNNLEND